MAVKLLDKDEWTKDGRKWIFYDYVKNLDGTRRKYKSKKFFTKTEALKAEREFLTINTERSDKDRNMTFKDLYTLFYSYKEDKVKYTTLKTYRDREKFFKNLDNVKLKDFNIEHFEKWKKQINSYGYTTNHKNHLFKFFKELLNFATKWYNFNFTATYNKMTNFTDPNEIPKEMLFFTYDEFKKFMMETFGSYLELRFGKKESFEKYIKRYIKILDKQIKKHAKIWTDGYQGIDLDKTPEDIEKMLIKKREERLERIRKKKEGKN